METVIEVTPVLRAQAEAVQGNGKPLVELVLSRSSEVTRELESIDHAQP